MNSGDEALGAWSARLGKPGEGLRPRPMPDLCGISCGGIRYDSAPYTRREKRRILRGMTDDDDCPPEGYALLPNRPEIELFAGPHYIRQELEGWRLGFRVKRRHLNKMGVCHGGVLGLFADLQGTAIKRNERLNVDSPTITVSLDFAAPARLGDWVHAAPTLVRRTPAMIFFSALIMAEEEIAARASGIYRLRDRRT